MRRTPLDHHIQAPRFRLHNNPNYFLKQTFFAIDIIMAMNCGLITDPKLLIQLVIHIHRTNCSGAVSDDIRLGLFKVYKT